MHRRIVVPVNESGRSERAIPIAANFARRMGASIALVTVVDANRRGQEALDVYHEWLLRPYRDLEAESIVVSGEVTPGILAATEPGDVLCIGVDRTSAVGELLFTSTFFDLVRKFRGPIIAVGPHASIPDDAERMLICLDGSARAEKSIDQMREVAAAARLEPFLVQAIHARNRDPHDVGDVPDSAYLYGLTHRVKEAEKFGWDVLHGAAAVAIAASAEGEDVAAVALATEAQDPVARLLSPSLTNELIGLSGRPLVVFNSNSPVFVKRKPIRRCTPDPTTPSIDLTEHDVPQRYAHAAGTAE